MDWLIKANNISVKIKTVMLEKRISQKALAIDLGVSEPTLSKMLSGRNNFTIKTICKIEEIIKTRVI